MKKFILFSILLFSSTFALADSKPKQQTPTNHHCQNLSKITDIDDLLYQMYSNIDSQCLFKMDTQELEKIWGIPIFDYVKNHTEEAIDAQLERRKQVREHEDTLYIIKSVRHYNNNLEQEFNVYTSDLFKEKYKNYGGYAELGKLPKLLPPPDVQLTDFNALYAMEVAHILTPQKTTEYESHFIYYWFNSFKNRRKPFIEIHTTKNSLISIITLNSNAIHPEHFKAFKQRSK